MLAFILGVIMYVITVNDILKTTLSLEGGGWMTNQFSKLIWKISVRLARNNGRSKILGKTGYVILTGIIIFWVGLLWGSFSLLLFSDTESLVTSTDKVAVNGIEKLYFAGYTLSTLGSGEYIPATDFWRIVTNIFSFTGLVLLTMSVTYFVPLLQAVIEQQKLAVQISGYGENPQEMIINTYDGKHYQGLTSNASQLTLALIKHTQNHKAYPVIHYFHNNNANYNTILELSKIHECLIILQELVKEEHRPKANELRSLKVAFDNYFKVIAQVTGTQSQENQDVPTIKTDKLQEKGFINADIDTTCQLPGRKQFYTLVKNDGWQWENLE